MRSRHFWLALGIGAAAGGAIALLYAPQTGAATRKKMKGDFGDPGDSLRGAADYLKDQAERLGKEAEKFIEASKSQIEDAVDVASDVMKSASKTASKATR